MTPQNISIEWAGYTAKGTHLDVATFTNERAAALLSALALGAFELRRLAKVYELRQMTEAATDASGKADMLGQLVDAMRAEG